MSTEKGTLLSSEFYEKAGIECVKAANDGAKLPPKAFPFYPHQPPETLLHRTELMRQLDMWEVNNPAIAKRHAQSLIELIKEQFGLE